MKKFLFIISMFASGLAVWLWYQNYQLKALVLNCQPTFVDGGGPYYLPNAPFRNTISPEKNNGSKLFLSGRVVKNDCLTPVPNVVVDVWHADETGKYINDWYRGQVKTNEKGEYSFETIVPKGYGEGTGYRPPHIHFKIFQDGREIITSQMFFPDVEGKFEHAYIMKITEKKGIGATVFYGKHDIVLP